MPKLRQGKGSTKHNFVPRLQAVQEKATRTEQGMSYEIRAAVFYAGLMLAGIAVIVGHKAWVVLR